MFKRILMWGTALLLLGNYASAQNFFISGGHAFSAVICGNGSVFTWGSNDRGQLGRTLTSGLMTSIPDIVGLPKEINAIDAGSGSHVVALACDGTVFTWGAGDQGQLGDGIASTQSSYDFHQSVTPIQVLAGETSANKNDLLKDIIYVTSGTSQSYAITKDQELVAWGSNEFGQLGNNKMATMKESSYPVYVVDSKGNRLKNVIAVDAGDTHCYALVDDDNDGDTTTGRVYAWGGHTYNPVVSSYETNVGGTPYDGKSLVAPYAVLIGDSDKPTAKPLTGIFQITAGDAAGFFIQKGTGFVYSVGSDDGGIRGDLCEFCGGNFAVKVESGELKPITGDDYLSNVIAISGTQATGLAAVDVNGTGRLMTWGRGPYDLGPDKKCGGDFALLGLGATVAKGVQTPRFIKDASGKFIENVVGVSDGDGVAFAITQDPVTKERKILVWGCNAYGQLGLGDLTTKTQDYTNRYVPAEFILPPCKMAEPCPVADLGPSQKFVCPGRFSDELYAGSEGKYFTYKWTFTDPTGVNVRDVTKDVSKTKGAAYLPIRRLGKYKVEISDNRPLSEMTCSPCPVAIDEIEIIELQSPFDTVFPSFCGADGRFEVSVDPLKVTDYEFFSRSSALETGDKSLGKLGDANVVQSGGKIQVSVAGLKTNAFDKLAADYAVDATPYLPKTLAQVSDSVYSIWVEDKTISKGTIQKTIPVGLTAGSGSSTNLLTAASAITVYSNVYLESFDITLSRYCCNAATGVVTPVIYGSTKNSNNFPMADYTNVLWTGLPQTINVPAVTANSNVVVTVKLEDAIAGVAKLLENTSTRGNTYWISLKVTSGNIGDLVNYTYKPSNFPVNSVPFGSSIALTGACEGGANTSFSLTQNIPVYLHNYKLIKPTDYVCGRKEISIIKNCPPCHGIDKTSLVAKVSEDTLCAGDKATVSFTATKLSTADANLIKFEWSYWDGKSTSVPSALPSSGYLGTLKSSDAFDASNVGYYIVKLYDDTDKLNGQCIFRDTVRIDTATTPKYKFGAGQTLCKGDPFNTIDLDLTGFGPWNVTLDGTPLTLGTSGATTYKHTITPTGAKIYSLTTIKDKYCTGNVVGGSTSEVKVNPLPTSTFTDPKAVCVKTADVDVTKSLTVTGVNPAKTVYSGTSTYLSASGVFKVPYVSVKTSFPLYVNYEDNNGCKFGDTANIVVNPTPVVTFALDPKYCSEATINYGTAVSPVATLPATGVFTVSPLVTLSGGTVAANLLNHKTDYTFSYLYTDANGCDTTVSAKTYSITVPEIVTVKDSSVAGVKAGTSVSGDLTATRNDASATINWIDPSGTALTGVAYADKETINVTHTATSVATTFVYKAYQTIEGCVGKTKDVTFSISPCSALVPIVENAYFCAEETGRQITADLDPTRATDQIGWIDGTLGATAFTNISSYTDSKVTGSSFYKIADNLKAGEYKYYVAAWEAANQCWSSAKEVTFIVKANPTAKIESQAKAACYNYTEPKDITVTPFYNALGITPRFTVDGVAKPVPQYLPSTKSTGGTMTLTYEVDSLITPAGYASSKTCASNTATAVYTVEFANAPTVTSVTVPVDQFPYTSVTATPATGNTVNWYTSATAPRTVDAATLSYDPSKGVKYDVDTKFIVYATQVTANGCESADASTFQELVKCKHLAPVAAGFKECANTLDGSEALTLTSASPTQSPDAVYTWYDADGTTVLGTGKSFKPTNIIAGPHTVKVGVVDWTDPVLLPGKTCPSPKSEVTYEIYETPVPSISGIVADMCIYNNPITLRGQNNGGGLDPQGIGVFNISNAMSETSATYSFSPSTMKKGERIISFTYTTENGCTEQSADYSIEVHEVPAPVIDANSYVVPQIDEILSPAYGGKFTFTGTPASGTSLQWFTTKPAVISTASSTNVGSSFIYTLSPQPVNRVDLPDAYDYTVYANQMISSPITCYSEPIDVKITTTDCPTPKPTVTDAIACDYWTGTKVPALVGTRGTNWGTYTPDANTSMYKTVNGTESLSADGKHVFTDVSVASKVYTVEYRVYSPANKCFSPKVTAKLDVKTIAKPTVIKGAYTTCFDDVADRTFEVATVAGQKATWYTSGDSTSTKLGSDTKYSVNPKDGSITVYASMKLVSAPYCESNPALASATLTVNPDVKAPDFIDTLKQCATSFDIDPNTKKAKFPSATWDYVLSADNGTATDDVVWRLINSKSAAVYNTGSLISIIENDPQVGLLPGAESELYAFSVHKYGTLSCSSTGTKAVIKPKPTPLKPAKIVDGAVSTEAVTFICQGSEEAAPVYRAQKSFNGDVSWYDELGYALSTPISVADTLDLAPYLETSGQIMFIATETYDDCVSDTTTFIFEVAPRPQPMFEADTLYFCANNIGSKPLAIKDTSAKKDDIFSYEWFYSDEDGDAKELETTVDAYIKTWYYTTPGIDEASVVVTNTLTGCRDTATIRLIVAEKITPSFGYDVYSGPQEIVFRNQATNPTISSTVWDPQTIESETYSTRYNWTYVYNADQSVRKMVQKDSTEEDRADSLYYVGRGPSDYDNVIEIATDYTDPITGVRTVTYRTKVHENGKPVSVTNFKGKTVQVHGGIPFEYGTSTVTLTRSVFTMNGIPYDTRSCNVTSPEVEVFMPITTGLFIPTSFAPGHASPLVSVFKPYGDKVAKFNIWVYDNWGNTVFYSNKTDENGQPTEAWDGRDKAGNLMPADVYYWKVDATFEDGTKWEGNPTENGKKKPMGSVFLLR